ncbi:hypothetical protein FRC04_009431 [Tulasnella sp. 424]|nr:hypothetical protein FRC04_009431 [Tulasnella sp. 424]
MKLLALCTTSLSFIPSLISAIAIPAADVVAPRNETSSLEKRGGEVNYLSNCLRVDVNLTSGYYASYIAWYSNVDNSQSGQRPDSLSSEYRDWSKGGAYLTWEGQQQEIYFPDSGAIVRTHIDSDAKSRAFTAYAGWAQRVSDGRVFNCYKGLVPPAVNRAYSER